MKSSKKLPRRFYLGDTVDIARSLLGCVLWKREGDLVLAARLVEVEAYLGPDDLAAHSKGGRRTARTEVMFGPPGHAYVYFTYGMHWCMNVVTQEKDTAEAVLLRAAEPLQGIDVMRRRRPKAKRDCDLMNGPGKLCSAMGIDRTLDGEPLDGDRLFLTARDLAVRDEDIAVSTRIGVENAVGAAHWPLRFYLRGNRHVSAYRNGNV